MSAIETVRGKTTAASNTTSFAPQTHSSAELSLPAPFRSVRQERVDRLLNKMDHYRGAKLAAKVAAGKISWGVAEMIDYAGDPTRTTAELEKMGTSHPVQVSLEIIDHPNVSARTLFRLRDRLTGVGQVFANDRLIRHPDCDANTLTWAIPAAAQESDNELLDVIANHPNADENTIASLWFR
jgi:hypothetical protein